jgi:catechol 2,3-dioxygenase-like lactoylglutathione lyase family enzyme
MVTGHSHTSLTVSDIERSIAFYTRILGFRVERTFEAKGPAIERITGLPGAHLKVAHLRLGEFDLELIQYLSPQGVRLDTSTQNVGAAHIAFYADEMDRTFRELKEKGVHFKGEPVSGAPGRPRVAYFLDPDGITLELVERQ